VADQPDTKAGSLQEFCVTINFTLRSAQVRSAATAVVPL